MKFAAANGHRAAPLLAAAAATLVALVATLAGLPGCTNKPFDPESLSNQPPVATIFISPVEVDSLNPTSYYQRTFHWSGSDVDGFVVDFFVAIQPDTTVPAVWDTTTATDTTLTFPTDDEGQAYAFIQVACRDDRGAVSETAERFVPLRNFPPVINFQADYDSVDWSYGAVNFRFFAVDLDGNETMADSFRYKLDTADTTVVWDFGEPGADPATGWVRRAFEDIDGRTFEIELHGLSGDPVETLTVSVMDEALADTRFHWTWQVREPLGPVLLVADASTDTNDLYHTFMNMTFGPGLWSAYEIVTAHMPDRAWVLTETFRQFDVVLWYTGSGTSQNLLDANGAIRQYLDPPPGEGEPGQLLLISPKATGAETNLPFAFIQEILGVSPTAAPANLFYVPQGRQALGLQPHLPAITAANNFGAGTGLQPLDGTETIFQMEYCRTCYGGREPFDPYIAVRRPARPDTASVVLITLLLDNFVWDEVYPALQAVLTEEMGVTLP